MLSPSCPVSSPGAEPPSPTEGPRRPLEHIAFTVPYTMSGQPVVSIRCGYTGEGLQTAGRRFDDLGVLRMAATFEGIRQPQRAVPL